MYIDSNHKKRVASIGNKGKWPLFEASCLYIRQVAVTCRGGTSVVRNLKFLTPFFVFLIIIINIILSTNCSYVISLCDTNSTCCSALYIGIGLLLPLLALSLWKIWLLILITYLIKFVMLLVSSISISIF